MKKILIPAYANVTKSALRSLSLLALSALLSFGLFLLSVCFITAKDGMTKIRERMGADVLALPYEVSTKKKLDAIALTGNTGPFYMRRAFYEEICALEGVETACPRIFLFEDAERGVSILGYEPELDFVLRPWIRDSLDGDPGALIAGAKTGLAPGDAFSLFGEDFTVTARLDETGDELDSCLFASPALLQRMIGAGRKSGAAIDCDPDEFVSCVLIRVREGTDPERVCNEINVHFKKLVAVQTKSLVGELAGTLGKMGDRSVIPAGIALGTALLIFTLSVILLTLLRKRELGILRSLGQSKGEIFFLFLAEGAMLFIPGSVFGALLGLLLKEEGLRAASALLSLPLSGPDTKSACLIFLLAGPCAALYGMGVSALTGRILCRKDAGELMRSR